MFYHDFNVFEDVFLLLTVIKIYCFGVVQERETGRAVGRCGFRSCGQR